MAVASLCGEEQWHRREEAKWEEMRYVGGNGRTESGEMRAVR
jgi:hypothetical protein